MNFFKRFVFDVGTRLVGRLALGLISKSIVTVGLILAVLSCDAFLYPHGGRYNPLDPDNKLVQVNGRSILILRDGYVEDLDLRYFNAPMLITQRNIAPASDILMQFAATDLPEFVDLALLELYVTPTSLPDGAYVNVIAEPWNESTVNWGQIQSPSFIDFSVPPIPYIEVVAVDTFVSCDVTEYIVHMQKTGKNFGFLISSWSEHLEFDSSRGPNPPRLRVWGAAIPD